VHKLQIFTSNILTFLFGYQKGKKQYGIKEVFIPKIIFITPQEGQKITIGYIISSIANKNILQKTKFLTRLFVSPRRREILFDTVYLKNVILHLSNIKYFNIIRTEKVSRIIIIFVDNLPKNIMKSNTFNLKTGDFISNNYYFIKFSIIKKTPFFITRCQTSRTTIIANRPEKVKEYIISGCHGNRIFSYKNLDFFILKEKAYRSLFISGEFPCTIFRIKRCFENLNVNKYSKSNSYSIFRRSNKFKEQRKVKYVLSKFKYLRHFYCQKINFNIEKVLIFMETKIVNLKK